MSYKLLSSLLEPRTPNQTVIDYAEARIWPLSHPPKVKQPVQVATSLERSRYNLALNSSSYRKKFNLKTLLVYKMSFKTFLQKETEKNIHVLLQLETLNIISVTFELNIFYRLSSI